MQNFERTILSVARVGTVGVEAAVEAAGLSRVHTVVDSTGGERPESIPSDHPDQN